MPRKYLHFLRHTLALIFALSLFSLPAQAAKKKEEPQIEFTIPIEEVPNYLSPEQLRDWRELQRNLKFARADLETGEWLANKAYSAFVAKTKTDADRKKGQQMIKEATERLATLNESETKFRVMAEQFKQQYQAQFETQEIAMTIESMALIKATQKPTESMLYKLWNDSYSKIYFGGAYVFSDGYYTRAEQLSKELLDTIARYDGNRYSLEEDVHEFTIDSQNGRPVIAFENSEDMIKRFRTAMLIVEIIYDPASPTGIYAIHAIDLKDDELIDQIILTYPIDESSRETLGILTMDEKTDGEAATEPAKDVAATEPAKDAKPDAELTAGQGLRLKLLDDNNFLGRLGDAKDSYTFDIAYIGQIDGFDQRAAIILNQALMRKQGLKVDDLEFVVKALPLANEDVKVESVTNATWRVSPTSPVDFGIGEYNVQAVADNKGREVKVDIGALTVVGVDSSGIPPQAANR